jgi:hypothetical protein
LPICPTDQTGENQDIGAMDSQLDIKILSLVTATTTRMSQDFLCSPGSLLGCHSTIDLAELN